MRAPGSSAGGEKVGAHRPGAPARRILMAALPLPLLLGIQLAAPQEDATEPTPADQFQTGNRLYQAGDYQGALDAYLGVYEGGLESGELHYNIGNSYFKLGQLGRSILFYERARLALPRDESVLANIELARSLTADEITPLPGFWVSRVASWAVELIPRPWLIVLGTLAYLALAAALLLRLLSDRPRPWTRHAVVAAAVLTVVAGANLYLRESGFGRAERGVIVRAEATVQSAPSDDPSLQLFTIHEGAVVRIDRRSSDWLEVVLEDGKVGWVRAGAIETIG